MIKNNIIADLHQEAIERMAQELSDSKEIAYGCLPEQPTNEYIILSGWDMRRAIECDREWGPFHLRVFNYIYEHIDECKDYEKEYQVEHIHWCWRMKHIQNCSELYNWFYLIIEDSVQAAALTYHPKLSRIDGANIFYIEFLATAPWNNKNPLEERKYTGLGSLLLKHISSYMNGKYSFRPGFCLHALPQAVGFYEHIGMQLFPHLEKEGLSYYEISEEKAISLMEKL
jgi:hypothetical protein